MAYVPLTAPMMDVLLTFGTMIEACVDVQVVFIELRFTYESSSMRSKTTFLLLPRNTLASVRRSISQMIKLSAYGLLPFIRNAYV